jgi:hypothetical protein
MIDRRNGHPSRRHATASVIARGLLLVAVGFVAVGFVSVLASPTAGAATTTVPPQLASPRWSFGSVSDENELANELAEATADLDVCFGWRVSVNSETATVGSNFGPEKPLVRAACENGHIELVVNLFYASETSEDSDSGNWFVDVSIPAIERAELPPGVLRNLVSDSTGMSTENLLGDNDDEALTRMVLALPLLYSEHIGRNAPSEALAAVPETAAIDEAVDSSPGSDRMRQAWPIIAVFVIAGAAFGAVVGYAGAYMSLQPSTRYEDE